jgi:hypothetical protein
MTYTVNLDESQHFQLQNKQIFSPKDLHHYKEEKEGELIL